MLSGQGAGWDKGCLSAARAQQVTGMMRRRYERRMLARPPVLVGSAEESVGKGAQLKHADEAPREQQRARGSSGAAAGQQRAGQGKGKGEERRRKGKRGRAERKIIRGKIPKSQTADQEIICCAKTS